MAVRPTGGSRGAVAQAFLGLAADPLDPVQQREARQRSGIAGRRTVEEKKYEKGDAGQQGEPGDRHMPFPAAGEAARSLVRASRILAVLIVMHSRNASPIGDEVPRVPGSVADGAQNGSSIAWPCRGGGFH